MIVGNGFLIALSGAYLSLVLVMWMIEMLIEVPCGARDVKVSIEPTLSGRELASGYGMNAPVTGIVKYSAQHPPGYPGSIPLSTRYLRGMFFPLYFLLFNIVSTVWRPGLFRPCFEVTRPHFCGV